MIVRIFQDRASLSLAAAIQSATAIRNAIQTQGRARIIVATGTSQLDFLDALTKAAGIDWQRVEMFHLDEYVGLSIEHPASFRKYLLERFIGKVKLGKYHFLNGETDSSEVARSVGDILQSAPVDVAFAGIGENGHLAFNDPPADFTTTEPYLIVTLDEACRKQQVGEGWFKDLSEVPARAISMSVRQILRSREIVCVVPDARKAEAVAQCFQGEISPLTPASILRTHRAATVYLDAESASLLDTAAFSISAAATKSGNPMLDTLPYAEGETARVAIS